jgi:hypothetical protein
MNDCGHTESRIDQLLRYLFSHGVVAKGYDRLFTCSSVTVQVV